MKRVLIAVLIFTLAALAITKDKPQKSLEDFPTLYAVTRVVHDSFPTRVLMTIEDERRIYGVSCGHERNAYTGRYTDSMFCHTFLAGQFGAVNENVVTLNSFGTTKRDTFEL